MPAGRSRTILVAMVPNRNGTVWTVAADFADCDLDCRAKVGQSPGCGPAYRPASRKRLMTGWRLFRMTAGSGSDIWEYPGWSTYRN